MALTSFSNEIKISWQAFANRWRTVIILSLLPIIPFLFTVPYLVELSQYQANELPPLEGTTVTLFAIAFVAAISTFILREISKAGIFVSLSEKENLGAKKSLQIGTKRFPAFLYTEILVVIFVFVSLIPAILVNYWFVNFGKAFFYPIMNQLVADILALLVVMILLIPAFIVGTWLSFASLISATSLTGGFTALTKSVTIVRPVTKRIFKRLLGWIILASVASYVVSPLPVARWLVPFIILLVGTAFSVTVYKEASSNGSRSRGRRRVAL